VSDVLEGGVLCISQRAGISFKANKSYKRRKVSRYIGWKTGLRQLFAPQFRFKAINNSERVLH